MNKLFPIKPVPNDENVIKQLQLKSFPSPKGKQVLILFIEIIFFGYLGVWSISVFASKILGFLWIFPILISVLFCFICYCFYAIKRKKKFYVYTNASIIFLVFVDMICNSITLALLDNLKMMSIFNFYYFLFYIIPIGFAIYFFHKECKHYYERVNYVPLSGKVPVVSGSLTGLAGYFAGKLLLSWTTPQVIGLLVYLVIAILFIPVSAKIMADCRYYDVIEDFTKDE